MARAIYAFSGDPITYGHINIIKRAAEAFPGLVVAIGVNPDKIYTFTLEERRIMASLALGSIPNVHVTAFEGLLVDFAYEQDISVIIKGVRNAADFNYERTLHQVGESQKLGIDTHILFADPTLAHISSKAVKQIYKNNYGDIHEFVPLYVKQMIERKLSNQLFIGVTGEIASGKSTFCYIATSLKGSKIHNIDMDVIAHDILSARTRGEPLYRRVRLQIIEEFGKEIVGDNKEISRKVLGDIVFRDKEKMEILNDLLRTPILVRFKREIANKEGIILVNSALLAEADMLYLCNNNVILTKVDDEVKRKRLKERGLDDKQIDDRLSCQYSFSEKRRRIAQQIALDNHGFTIVYDSSDSQMNTNRVAADLNTMTHYYGDDYETLS